MNSTRLDHVMGVILAVTILIPAVLLVAVFLWRLVGCITFLPSWCPLN